MDDNLLTAYLPLKSFEECTAQDYVDVAVLNLSLWKQNPEKDYLIFAHAIPYLHEAMRKLRSVDTNSV